MKVLNYNQNIQIAKNQFIIKFFVLALIPIFGVPNHGKRRKKFNG